ncbi:hypothetical protein HDU92_005888 [Lobulomyces angularis]|nr:hypothetical protein HDU92_005888 [Lobulomyces angularis]
MSAIEKLKAKSKGKEALLKKVNDEEEFDVDNMDFELPTEEVGRKHTEEVEKRSIVSPYQQHQLLQEQQLMQQNEFLKRIKDWQCIYPVYIDASKPVSEGRRISTKYAVKEPACCYIAEACKRLNFQNVVVESGKRHPRDQLTYGRVRINLRKPDGSFVNPKISSKNQLLRKVAELMEVCEADLLKLDPRIAAHAAQSRSVVSKECAEIYKSADKEVKAVASGNKKKKNKK